MSHTKHRPLLPGAVPSGGGTALEAARQGTIAAMLAVRAPLRTLTAVPGIAWTNRVACHVVASVTTCLAATGRHRRAVAAVEFALIAPVLAMILIGAADYGIAQWTRSCLANAVAQGAYYAFRTGPGVAVSTVASIVENASSLSAAQFRISGSFPVACYCPSGSPATLGTAVSTALPCTATCPDDGTKAAAYLTITAPYALPFWISIPFAGALNLSTLTESATVRLQ